MTNGNPSPAADRDLIRAGEREGALGATTLLCALAGLTIALHLPGMGRYGFFRDELYYIACGEHLAWGYVDQPPLIALMAWISRHLFGNSLAAFRVFPVLAGAALLARFGIIPTQSEIPEALQADIDAIKGAAAQQSNLGEHAL